ncbi:MAG: NUDIX domain-containing protein [Nocardioides sp.]|nr:NUDIX domain-containing protein [Nocardioides sp.]
MAIHRVTARVLPVSPDGAVLLLQEQDPARPGELYWSSIGGAVDAGESLRDAAVRELGEETGILVDPAGLVGPAHRGEQPYSWAGVDHLGDHTYFAVATSRDVEISVDRLEPEEVGNILGAGWWTPADLGAGVASRPPDLREITSAAVAAGGRDA